MERFYSVTLSFILLLGGQMVLAQRVQKEFSFGKAHSSRSIVLKKVEPYSSNGQYGFEYGTEKSTAIRQDSYTLFSEQPFYFSVHLPEGNYKVTISYQGLPDKIGRASCRDRVVSCAVHRS